MRVPPADVRDDPCIVETGDEVVVEYDAGGVQRHAIVESVAAALGDARVSVTSPLGQALLGRSSGDAVTVDAPAGQYRCVIRRRPRTA